MRNFTLSFLIFFLGITVGASLQAQPCTPDTTLGSMVGAYPDSLPPGIVGQPYSATINFILPTDTTVLGFPLQFCSFALVGTDPELDSIGLSVACATPDCVFPIDHSGGVNRACAVLSGTLTQPVNGLTVSVNAVVGTYDAQNDTCLSSGSVPPLPIPFTFPFVVSDTSSTGLEALTARDVNLKVYPNPTEGLTTLAFYLPQAAEVNITLMDVMGKQTRTVFNDKAMPGQQVYALGNAFFSSGIYLIRISLNQGEKVFTEKLLVR